MFGLEADTLSLFLSTTNAFNKMIVQRLAFVNNAWVNLVIQTNRFHPAFEWLPSHPRVAGAVFEREPPPLVASAYAAYLMANQEFDTTYRAFFLRHFTL